MNNTQQPSSGRCRRLASDVTADVLRTDNCDVSSWVSPCELEVYSWMKKSSPAADCPPPCALSSLEVGMPGNSPCQGKDDRIDRNYSHSPVNRTTSGRNPQHAQQRQKCERMNQSWSNTVFDNSNASWEGDWSTPSITPPMKTESPTGSFYKNRTPGPYQSSDWSHSDSSASSSLPSSYGMMHTPQQSPSNSLSASSSSFYESNGFYNSGYNYGQNAYVQPPYGQQQQQHPMYQQSVRMMDGASGPYNSNRNPANCPPTLAKQPVPEFQRRQMRYGLDGMPKMQIKREPEEYGEMDGDNFSTLFTKSLTSLYSQDNENAFSEENKPYDSDIMVLNPPPNPVPVMEEPPAFQRLHPSNAGQYPGNMANDYQDARTSFGFYENRNQNCDTAPNIVQNIGAEGNHMNSFRYDRPSFDDMHLYASPSNDSKAHLKKRKVSMPNIPPDNGFTENRKKTPRLMSFKSDSKWTPNSFAFSEIQIKQEPVDDYSTTELDSPNSARAVCKDNSPGSNGSGNGKSTLQSDHPKPPPRKRSPGATCFDRFDKKSTPTNKKVSPLSVYAKVQESVVLSVKCRRYKKRTKPISNKEETSCPGREEMEIYKRASLTPDQAAHQVMCDLLERVSLFSERSVIDGPDLTQVDVMKIKELLMQFCHRYSLDYRDFENINSVLKPRIVKDKSAKNSERASAIRKRTSISPVQPDRKPEPANKTPKSEKGPKKNSNEDSTPGDRRVLRKLPGRVDRSRPRRRGNDKVPIVRRRYSTRSAKDVEEVRSSDVDIIIDSSMDRESEAGKEAEVRKKSQRLKNKQPVMEMPARERSSDKARKNVKIKKEETRTRSKEVKVEKSNEAPKTVPKKKWTRLHHMNSNENRRSSSVEIVDITKSESQSSSDLSTETFKKKPLSSAAAEKVKNDNKKSEGNKREVSKRILERKLVSNPTKKLHVEKKSIQSSTVHEDADTSSPSRTVSKPKGDSLKKGGNLKKEPSVEKKNSSKGSEKKIIKVESDDTLSESEEDSDMERGDKMNLVSKMQRPVFNKRNRRFPSPSKLDNSSKVLRRKGNQPVKVQDVKKVEDIKVIEVLSDSEESPKANDKKTDQNKASDGVKNSKTPPKESEKCIAKVSEVKTEISMDTCEVSISQPVLKETDQKCSQDNGKRQDSFSCLMKKIKEEPEEVASSSSQEENCPLKSALTAEPSKDIHEVPKPAKIIRNLPIKKIPRRRSSQHSESELQVVLTKLPDSQSMRNGSVPADEAMRMCDRNEVGKNAPCVKIEKEDKEKKLDMGNPPELMRMQESSSSAEEINKSVKIRSFERCESAPPPLKDASDIPINLSINGAIADKNSRPQSAAQDHYYDSDDSDCGLVIDLDRRTSVEERVPSPTLQSSDKICEAAAAELRPESSASTSWDECSLSTSVKRDPTSEESKKATEDACLLLHLSRSAVPPLTKEYAFHHPVPVRTENNDLKTNVKEDKENKDPEPPEKDESILRTLLLENGDVASGSSQDVLPQPQPGPSTAPTDSKARIDYEAMRTLMYQAYQEMSSLSSAAGLDPHNIPIEQLSVLNANILSEAEDISELGNDPRTLKERIKKLKNEIMCLQFMADQKDKERIAIVCFKRYKEEVLKKLLKEYANSVHGQVQNRAGGRSRPSNEGRNFDPNNPFATYPYPFSAEDEHHRHTPDYPVIEVTFTPVPSATITNGESIPCQCGERLPAVSAESYGVDMRTVNRGGGSSARSEVKEIRSSRESANNTGNSGSPMSSEQRRRSPSLPELSPSGRHPQHFLMRIISSSSSSSLSPPSLQPELWPTAGSSFASPSSSFQTYYPHPLAYNSTSSGDVKMESSRMDHNSSTSRKSFAEMPKNSPRSSPKKSSSYSVWSNGYSGRNTPSNSAVLDLHTEHSSVQETSSRRPASNNHPLMVAPPPTMLQSALKHSSGHHRSRLEIRHESRSEVRHGSRSEIHHEGRSEIRHERSSKNNNGKHVKTEVKTEEEQKASTHSSPANSNNSNVPPRGHSSGSSSPHVSRPSSTLSRPPRCMGCGTSDAKFLCSGCRKHWYCSAKCQTMRWPDHSPYCTGRQYSAGPRQQ
ncbi:uncharacterized protein TNIN_44991 [Trichonephila inaurata madagascariensis]|uniref:MYND-type domain-containing protein n=1 Tax=Trichonephila inaurata madagascariensis TaxID=2747483 RepID=A0A8X6WYI2_9ARAC|nr:uncharacterized protein TNIN_44991 [Trichonephila inaurata madagascariensis]